MTQLSALDLSDLYKSGIENGHQSKSAKYTAKKNSAIADQVVGLTLPQVSFNSQIQHAWASTKSSTESPQMAAFPKPSIRQRSMDYSWGLHMEQTLNVFRLGVVVDGAKLQIQAFKLQSELSQEQIKIAIAQAYTHVYAAKDQLDLNQKISESNTTLVNSAVINHNTGALSQASFNQIKANALVAQAELKSAQNNLATSLETLNLLTAQDLQVDDLSNPIDEISKLERQSINKQQNLQIKTQDKFIQYNETMVSYNQSQHMPNLRLIAGIQNGFNYYDANPDDRFKAPSEYFDRERFNYYLGVKMSVPVYMGGSVTAKANETRLESKIQKENLNQAKRELEIQTKLLASQLITLKLKTEASFLSLAATKTLYKQALADQQRGEITYSDLLDQERQLKEISFKLTMSRSEYLLSLINFQFLNGQSLGDGQ